MTTSLPLTKNTRAEKRNLQENFLDLLSKDQIPVFIYLINGVKLQGTIEAHDQFVILLKSTLSQIVYKHTICSILPKHEIKVFPPTEETQDSLQSFSETFSNPT